MATVVVYTAERMQEIEDNAVVDARIDAGHLILIQHDGDEIDAGVVVPEPPTVVDHGNTGAAITIDVTESEWHQATQDESCVYTFTSPPDDGNKYVIKLLLKGITGTPNFPASVNWTSGSPPTVVGRAWLTFVTVNGGTDWDGFVTGQAMS